MSTPPVCEAGHLKDDWPADRRALRQIDYAGLPINEYIFIEWTPGNNRLVWEPLHRPRPLYYCDYSNQHEDMEGLVDHVRRKVMYLFDENDPAVLKIKEAIIKRIENRLEELTR